MGWISLSIAIKIDNQSLSCSKGDKTMVTLSVVGETDNQKARYNAYCYDQDNWDFDDPIFLTNWITIEPNEQIHETHEFTIECDTDCYVQGPDGGTGQTEAELFGFIEGTGGMEHKSDVVKVECT